MDEGADLKKDPSPARLCLDMLGNQLDEIERRQSEWDGRQKRWESENARVLTKLVQRLESLANYVAEDKGPSPELQTLQLEVSQLLEGQSETRRQLVKLSNSQLSPADPAIQDLRRRLDQALDALQKQSIELDFLKQLPLQASEGTTTESTVEFKTLQLELARFQSDQTEVKSLLRSLKETQLDPNDPTLTALRLRLDQALEALQKQSIELDFLKQLPFQASEGTTTESTVEFKTLQLELARVQSDQTEVKSLLKSLKETQLDPNNPALSALRHRLDQALETLQKQSIELNILKQLPLQTSDGTLPESAVEFKTIQLELARVQSEQSEVKSLLKSLKESRLDPDDPALTAVHRRLDQVLEGLARQGLELERLTEQEPSTAPQVADNEVLQAEFAKFQREQAEIKQMLGNLPTGRLDPADPTLADLRSKLDQALESLAATKAEVATLRTLRQSTPDDENAGTVAVDALQAEVARFHQEQAEARRLLDEIKRAHLSSDDPSITDLRERLDQALEALHHTRSEIETLRSLRQASSDGDSPAAIAADALQAELIRLHKEQAEAKHLLQELKQSQLDADDPAIAGLRQRLDQTLEAMIQNRSELDSLRETVHQVAASQPDDESHKTVGELIAGQSQMQKELQQVHHQQEELKELIRSLAHQPRGDEDTSSSHPGVNERIEQGFESLQNAVAELVQQSRPVASGEDGEAGRQLAETSQQMLAAQQALHSELAAVQKDQLEFKALLGGLLERQPTAAPSPDDSPLVDQLELALQELKSARTDIAALQQSVSSGASGSPAVETLNAEFLAAHEALARQVAELERERLDLRQQLESGLQAKDDSQLVAQLQQQLAESRESLELAQERIEALRSEGSSGGGGNEALIVEMSRLEEERDSLRKELEKAKSQPSIAGGDEALQDRLYDLEDELRQANKTIEQLRNKPAPSSGVTISSGGGWEAQKAALLAQLEGEDSGDSVRVDEVMSMEQVIKATDKAIANKDKEIEELQQLLAQQSESIGGVAVGAAAIEEILNHDELIQQERESLEKMKAEWREKFGKAEIEISMERAKLAREKKELESQIDKLQEERKKLMDEVGSGDADAAQKNRWFARLGLEKDK